jgi:hypothetical protein
MKAMKNISKFRSHPPQIIDHSLSDETRKKFSKNIHLLEI